MLDRTALRFSHVKPGDTEFKGQGLRDFFLYRDLGVATFEGFMQLAKVRGRRLTVASTGTGTVSHLTGIMFRQQMGLGEWTDVPYPGAAKAVTDVIGHHVDSIFVMVAPLVPFALFIITIAAAELS